ncbi:MAG: DUF3817 domain-containing protein [Chitinophagaceae bacterium]
MNTKKIFSQFRKIAFAEGVSFLVLLFIAMPLKYFADSPLAVRYVGMAHGVLFVAFIVWACLVKSAANKSLGWLVKSFIASIIPFGTFYMEKQWKKEENETSA